MISKIDNKASNNYINNYKFVIEKYLNYINFQRLNKTDFAFSNIKKTSPYARCFAIFGLYNFSFQVLSEHEKDLLALAVMKDLESFIFHKFNPKDFYNYKAPSQLLNFSLTALYCLGRLNEYERKLRLIIDPYLKINLKSYFFDHKVFTSEPRSGNFAMFIAVILIYARDWLKIDTQNQINYWVESHIKNLNKYSLWGNNDFYSQYQSSYHQYEIFNYLKIDIFDNKKLIRNIINLQDFEGHYGPYPGGGGCYDFDAIKILTLSDNNDEEIKKSINIFAKELIKEQNKNGGFSESYQFYPLKLKSQIRYLIKIISIKNIENLLPLIKQYFYIMLKNPVFYNNHFCVHTSKKWSDPDLWNSWFRVLALTNVILFSENQKINFRKIKFPGIGYSK